MAAYYATPSSSAVAHTSALQPYGQYPELDSPKPNVSLYDLPTDSENEAEVDELESDTDPEDELASSSANHKKGAQRLGERAPGTTLLPTSRVENMVHTDTSIAMSKEAVFILSVATEEFIKRIAQAGHRQASAKRRAIINYTDLACSTQQYQEFMFLQDTIPEPISITEALEKRAMKEKEDLEANPAMSNNLHRQSPAFIAVSAPQLNGKSKAKQRPPVASRDPSSASATGNSRREHRHNEDGGMDNIASRNWSAKVAHEERYGGSEHVSSDVRNEAVYYQDDVPWAASAPSPRRATAGLRPPPEIQETAQRHDFAPNWPGHFTGPASAFLVQDPHGAFGRGINHNSGRTIYSQEPRLENSSFL